MNFGERLITLRESKNISRKEFAEIMEIPYTTLRNYETNAREPGHLFLIKVARYFNVTVDYLLDVEKIKNGNNVSTKSEILYKAYDKANYKNKSIVITALELPFKEDIEQEESKSFRITARGGYVEMTEKEAAEMVRSSKNVPDQSGNKELSK